MADGPVLVVFDPRASSRRALARAAESGAPLTVVAVAPRDERGSRCNLHGPDLEIAVREAAARDLSQARSALGERRSATAQFVLLPARDVRELARWAAAGGFALALLGAHRAVAGIRAPDMRARALARAGVEVALVD